LEQIQKTTRQIVKQRQNLSHDRLHYCLGTGFAIQNGSSKLIYGPKTSPLSEMMPSPKDYPSHMTGWATLLSWIQSPNIELDTYYI